MSEVEELLLKLMRPPKLLLVESSQVTARAFKKSLSSYECVVDWVRTGEEALEQVGNNAYDMIFVDDSISKLVDVLRYLKIHVPYVPIVILGYINRLVDIGVVSLLPKNADIWDLESVFRTFKVAARRKDDDEWSWQPAEEVLA